MSMKLLPKVNRSWPALFGVTSLFVVVASGAQQPPTPSGAKPLETQLLSAAGQPVRVIPINGLSRPWALAFLPDGDILITERIGKLRIIRHGVLDPQPIAGIPEVSTALQQGLQDVAIHPRFIENRLVYFTYHKPRSDDRGVGTATLARGRFDGGSSLKDVKDVFVSDAWFDDASASRIAFGRDGKIYMSIGAARRVGKVGTAEDAQNPTNHAGKVLRLNDDGTVPSDNPFVGRPGYRSEIYALGIRNALALIVHPDTGDIWENENGPMGGDEINIIRAGRNYGWPVISFGRAYTGDLTGDLSGPTSSEPCAPGMEQPFLFWVPSIAPAGMAFYTGDKFPVWKGSIFVGALSGQLQRVLLSRTGMPLRRETMLTELKRRIREVRQGPDGLIYLLTDVGGATSPTFDDQGAGALLRVEPAPGS
jgi:glucose/arabinose dehydrogenase